VSCAGEKCNMEYVSDLLVMQGAPMDQVNEAGKSSSEC